MTSDEPTFARWLKQMRAAHDLTQRAFAEKIHCSVRTIEKIERGERQPSRQIAELIAEYFSVPPEEHADFLHFARDRSAVALPGWSVQEPRSFGAKRRAANPTQSGTPSGAPTDAYDLPTNADPFVGRDLQMALLSSLILSPDTRLVTIIGPPGIGKTRLAVEAARQVKGRFRDGVCFVALAHLSDAWQVLVEIAEALKVQNAEGRSTLDGIKECLIHKEMLLLLDNFEQVIEAAPQVAEIAEAWSGVKVLVTSREVLNVSPEHEFIVPPLSIPGTRSPDKKAEPDSYEAVRLFMQRARSVRPDLVWGAQEMAAVATICRMLEGVPLSIELAAARTRLIQPTAMLDRLESRLALLTGGPLDLPERHRTLRNAIEWSYSLLTAAEAQLFRRLAIFVGRRGIEAIEQVCIAREEPKSNASVRVESQVGRARDGGTGSATGTTGIAGTVDIVTSLVEKSLLVPGVGFNGQSRYGMLETIRQFAAEKLEETGELEAMKQRYVRYFLKLMDEAEPELRGPEQDRWLRRLQQEGKNLGAVFKLAMREGSLQLLLPLASTFGQFWVRCGYWSYGRLHLTELLERHDAIWHPVDKAGALYPLGYIAYLQGDYPYALSCFSNSLALFREAGRIEGVADSLNMLGFTTALQGERDSARHFHEESLATSRAAEYRLGVPFALYGLALTELSAGETRSGRDLAEESCRGSREIGDLLGIAYSLYCIGLAYYIEGDYEQARHNCEQSLQTSRGIEDRRGVALLLQLLGNLDPRSQPTRPEKKPGGATVADAGDDPGDVADLSRRSGHLQESLSLLSELGLRRYMPATLAGMGAIAAEQQQWDRAARLMGAAATLAERAGSDNVPGQQAQQERALLMLRSKVDAAQLEQPWAEGGRMSLSELIAYALDEAEQPL